MEGLLYSESHEWVKVEDGLAVIGVSDFAQKEMGEKGRAYYLRHFEKETCIRALEEIFASAAAKKTAAEEAK